MFEILNTELTTNILGAPKNWDPAKDGECLGLPVCYTETKGVQPQMFSWWKPRLKDRFLIALGVPIRFSVIGLSHPPVCLEISPDQLTPQEKRAWKWADWLQKARGIVFPYRKVKR